MELNRQLWSSADYRHHQDIVRSFKCSFCKRGFSNAQALGGHMNIHRKDRAKLRQLSYDNNEDDDDDDNDNDDDDAAAEHNMSNYRRIRRLKRSHNKGVENHQQQQIPLFMEATQWVGLGCDQIMHSSRIACHSGHESYDEDLLPELDLELRLGPEPDHGAMAACLGTRNFF